MDVPIGLVRAAHCEECDTLSNVIAARNFNFSKHQKRCLYCRFEIKTMHTRWNSAVGSLALSLIIAVEKVSLVDPDGYLASFSDDSTAVLKLCDNGCLEVGKISLPLDTQAVRSITLRRKRSYSDKQFELSSDDNGKTFSIALQPMDLNPQSTKLTLFINKASST